ncbi:autoinducer synthase [Maribius pontilimi]|uniref:Acyl-homoserine-lactone synthase n=1 Tax=Palleronia pontilimi TaxID=1964209 RepID=A0A934IJY0_9RHOB|nr:acyl-homoserine-lactone synthase [Palleronia pontilimi]MBJ3764321.1 autoinducer synthase [Palleronia pontilimi]
MIRFLSSNQLKDFPKLKGSMFRDRADQFQRRLGWEVSVDSQGFEMDEYDALNALYVIWERKDGQHGGSMRLLPTEGRCMVNEYFSHLMGGKQIKSPIIWECTRFCLSRNADSGTAAALMLAGAEVMTAYSLRHFVGVFDARMVRIYKRIGACPQVIGSQGEGRERISVGLWDFESEAQARISKNANIPPAQTRAWFNNEPLAHRQKVLEA